MEKILLLNDSGNFGGVQSVFRNIVKYGDFKSFDVDILFATNGPIYEEVKALGYKINYTQELRRLSNFEQLQLLFKFMLRINKEIKDNNYDKVYASGFLSCMACGILSYKYKNIKFIWHEHNMPKSSARKLIVKTLGKHIKKILVVSKAIKDRYPIEDDEKVVVLRNGIIINDNDFIEYKEKNILNLAIVSRIDRGKGHIEVIEAFKRLNNEDSRLYIIGNATSKKAEVIEEAIKEECKQNNKIIYVGYTKDVEKYYKKMDIVIQASTSWDSLPTVLIEAMNYNCALIGSNIGGIPEIIEKNNGYVIEVDNIVNNLESILALIKKDKALIDMQINSKKILKSKFALNNQISKINKLFKEV